jgi:hypothetical protein
MAFNHSRYARRRKVKNNDPAYFAQLRQRNVPFINQYTTPHLLYPGSEERRQLTIIKEVWKTGSRFYKYAQTYYEDPTLFWIIPWYNRKPLESDFKFGDIVLIPTPLSRVLSLFKG